MPQILLTHPKIAFISQPEYFRFTYENELEEFASVREFKFNYSMSMEQFSELLEYDANINIFFRGEYVPNEVLQQLKGIKINLSSEPFPREINHRLEYTIDSLKRYRSFQAIRCKSFDYVFHYDASSLSFMEQDGLKLSGEFPFPVATSVYKPMDVAKDWDIFFIGRSTAHREKFFGPLKHYYNFLHIAHGVWGPGLVRYINASNICLNIHAEDEISWEPRLQMMLACGVLVISEPVTPNRYLRPGTDYIVASHPQELYETVTHYLNHPDEREIIAKTGCERIQEAFSSNKAFKRLLQGIAQEQYPKFTVGPNKKSLEASLLIREYSRKFFHIYKD